MSCPSCGKMNGFHPDFDIEVAGCYLAPSEEASDMPQSVKLGDDIMALVRHEAQIQDRSVAGQITHWIRLGRAIEQSGNFNHDRLSAVLKGRQETSSLSPEEKDVWMASLTEHMSRPGPEEEAFFRARREQGLGVGLDEEGRIVHAGRAE